MYAIRSYYEIVNKKTKEYFDITEEYPEVKLEVSTDGTIKSASPYAESFFADRQKDFDSIKQKVLYPDQLVYLNNSIFKNDGSESDLYFADNSLTYSVITSYSIHYTKLYEFAMYLSFYIGVQKDEEGYFNIRDGERYKMLDDEYALEIFRTNYRLPIDRMIHIVMSDEKLWGINLTDISGFYEKVCEHVHSISTYGMKKVISSNVHG